MYALASASADDVNKYAWKRIPIIFGFKQFLADKKANGLNAKNLSQTAVIEYFGKIYELDAKICIDRAKQFNEIILSLDNTQKSKLDAMISGGFTS